MSPHRDKVQFKPSINNCLVLSDIFSLSSLLVSHGVGFFFSHILTDAHNRFCWWDQELKGNNGQISFSLLEFHNVLNTMFPLSASFFIHWLTKVYLQKTTSHSRRYRDTSVQLYLQCCEKRICILLEFILF